MLVYISTQLLMSNIAAANMSKRRSKAAAAAPHAGAPSRTTRAKAAAPAAAPPPAAAAAAAPTAAAELIAKKKQEALRAAAAIEEEDTALTRYIKALADHSGPRDAFSDFDKARRAWDRRHNQHSYSEEDSAQHLTGGGGQDFFDADPIEEAEPNATRNQPMRGKISWTSTQMMTH
jgi:hypothetical protein